MNSHWKLAQAPGLIYQAFAGASDLFYDFKPEIGALFPEYGIKHVLICEHLRIGSALIEMALGDLLIQTISPMCS